MRNANFKPIDKALLKNSDFSSHFSTILQSLESLSQIIIIIGGLICLKSQKTLSTNFLDTPLLEIFLTQKKTPLEKESLCYL